MINLAFLWRLYFKWLGRHDVFIDRGAYDRLTLK